VGSFLADAASSWNHISIGVQAVVPSSAALTRLAKFFKSRFRIRIFLRMVRPRLQAGQAELVQPFADRMHMNVDPKPTRNHPPQVAAPPASHLVNRRIRPLDNQFP
jgi:hypothetical protein